jgi:hypothetical protein
MRMILSWLALGVAVLLVLALASMQPALFRDENYADCVLKEEPGVENDVAAISIMQDCAARYPKSVEQGSGRSWFSYSSGAACAAKEARDTRSVKASMAIRHACNLLYDPPMIEELDPYSPSYTPPK